MIIHIHNEGLKSTLQVKPTTVFSTVVKHYYRNVGACRGDFYYRNTLIQHHDKTLSELGVVNEASIVVRNTRAADTSTNRTLEVDVYRVEHDNLSKYAVRYYSVAPGTRCESIVDTLHADLGVSNKIVVFNTNDLNVVQPGDGVSSLNCVRAIITA